ncbi:MAG: hypothetical protein WBL35_03205 [Ornithinibacter sp.]
MTTAYMPHLSAIAKRGGRRAPGTFTAWDNAKCEAAWRILGAGEGLQRLAHRISGGGTPLGDELTVSHLYRVGKAVGIPGQASLGVPSLWAGICDERHRGSPRDAARADP